MALELPHSGKVNLPEVPVEIRQQMPSLYEWMQRVKREVELGFDKNFSNTVLIATAMNQGTSGTFVISSGGSIIVTSGIVTTITS